MNQPLVSIIVPIYKVEPYLRRCLDSIVNQTYTNLEIILVDDGSPDNCPEICEEYAAKDNRIIVIHKENGGLSDARNAGLDICKGEYVYFIDSDDFVSSNAISILLNACEQNKADIAVGNHYSFHKESEISKETEKAVFRNISFEEAMRKQCFFSHEFTQIVVAWNKLIKTGIAKRFYFPKGLICEDNYTTFKYFYKTKAVATNTILYYYQNRKESIVNKLEGTKEDCIIAINYLNEKINFLRKTGYSHLIPLFTESLAEQHLSLYIRTIDKESKASIARHMKTFQIKKRPILNFALHHPKLWQMYKSFFK